MHCVDRLARMWIGCVIVLALFSGPTYAKYTPKVGARTENDNSAYLMVNGRDAAHLLTSNADLTPTQRAAKAAERLADLVQKGLDPATIETKLVGKNVRILVGETLIMVATPLEARAHKTTVDDLAHTWAVNLKSFLTMPPLSVSPKSLTVPCGETRTVTVETFLSDQIQMAISDPKVVSVDLQKKPGSMVVSGLATGDATITLKCQEYSVSVAVSVMKYAATISSDGKKAIVTGTSCPASLAASAARDIAIQSVILEPGARINSVSVPSSVRSIPGGLTVQVPVQVEAMGSGYIPIRFSVPVQVENRSLPQVPTTWIMYSNNPERLERYQTLFTGRLQSNQEATRLLYHHQNEMGRKIGFAIDVVNASPSPASLHVVEGVADPMLDTVIVGYAAGKEFMQNLRTGVGRVYEVPAGTRQVIVSQALGSSLTASGIMELRQLSGDPLLLRVTAEPEDVRVAQDSHETPVQADGIDPQKIALSEHIYPKPIQNVDVTYTAGKQWVFFRLGKDGLRHATQDLQLYGNYGVTYDIKATLDNPLQEPLVAEVAFEATAGPASGIFYLDDSPVRIRYLVPPSEVSLGRITVPAGKSKVVLIRTIPLSGSAYPATLIIRPVGTTATAGG